MPPIFEYKALDPSGKNLKGVVEADSAKTARQKLKKQGLIVTDVSEKTAASAAKKTGVPFVSGRVGISDVAFMVRQLASLVKANIPLVDALTALVEQTEHDKLKVVLSQVRTDVNEGLSLGKATAKHPKAFDTVSINMIEAGESSGTLGLVLLRLADLKESQMRLRNKLFSSMMYPVLMMLTSFALVVYIMIKVIPQIASVFEGMDKELPMVTKVMINTSGFMVDWWWALIVGAFVGASSFARYISKGNGKAWWDRTKLKMPVFGMIFRLVAITRFANTMSTLLQSGVPILSSLNIAKNLVDNVPIANAIATARENITEGQSIADPLRRSGEFPPMVIHMISIGEKTGELPGMLKNVSDTYEEQVNVKIEGLSALLEPAMIIMMGGVVVTIVMAVLLPLMEMSNINQR